MKKPARLVIAEAMAEYDGCEWNDVLLPECFLYEADCIVEALSRNGYQMICEEALAALPKAIT